MGRRGNERRKEENRIVMRSLAMVMQFGLNMLVPICMMTALGMWLDRQFGTSFLVIVLFAAGAVAGGQNIYRMAKGLYGGEQDAGRGASGDGEEAGGDETLK